jgi:hypothetical protein
VKKFILSVVAAGLSVGVVVAGPSGKGQGGNSHPSGGSHMGNHPSHMSGGYKGSSFSNYHLSHGKSFSHGFYYPGRYHNHWSFRCWWPKYGCYTYWCPSTSCYYYWCESANCYYPLSYASYAAPTQVQVQVNTPVTVAAPAPVVPPAPVAVPPAVQTQTQSQTQGLSAPPAGYPPLPQ